jgi:CHAD domain-containing protein
MTLPEKRIKRLSDGLSLSMNGLAKEPSPKYVHRLRTMVRRIESLLAFTNPDLNKKQKKTMDEMAGLRRRAGRIRDLDVQAELLGAIGNRSAAGDRKIIMDMLKRRRAKQARRFQEAVSRTKGSKFSSHMKRIMAKAGASADDSRRPLDQARQQLSRLSAGFSGPDSLKPNVMHELRIGIKMVRYLAELGAASAEQRAFLSAVKSAQDALGAWHDWQELAKTAERQFGDRMNCPLLVETRALLAARYSAARAVVARLLSTHNVPHGKKQPGSASAVRALAKPA